MDLSIPIEDTTLYIRVAVLVKTRKGFLLEQSVDGYLFTVGGKIKLNETSKEAAKREVKEEIGMQIEDVTLRSVIENLYTNKGRKVHEICFVYSVDEFFEGEIPKGFVEVPVSEIDSLDIKPGSIGDLLKNTDNTFVHTLHNESK
jgi:8-oxo-dGTP pyrophosphatase MutT (NUDIX family)